MFHRTRRAFTIIELLVVIGIITILITLGFVVAGKVSGSGKIDVTKKTIETLEQALAALTSASGGLPPPVVLDPRRPGAANSAIPIIDGRNMANGGVEMINSVGLFILQCQTEAPDAAAKLRDLDPKLIHEFDPDQSDSNPQAPSAGQQPKLLTAFDGWGNPIRYVHPAFKGWIVKNPTNRSDLSPVDISLKVQPPPGKLYWIKDVRRTDGAFDPDPNANPPYDSDGGMPIGTTPYFYSCGPDGDPSTIEDNIYSKDNRPRFPK